MKEAGKQLPLVALSEGENRFRVLSMDTRTMTYGRVRRTGTLATEYVEKLVRSLEELQEVEHTFLDAARSYAEFGVQNDSYKRLSKGDELFWPEMDDYNAQEKFKESLTEISRDKTEYETITIVRNLLANAAADLPVYRAQYLRMVEDIKEHYKKQDKKQKAKSA